MTGQSPHSATRESRTHFQELNLPPEFIAPNYRGRSIVNVAASITHLLGIQTPNPPLDAELLGSLADDVKRVVLVIVDALGDQRFRDALDTNSQNGFHPLIRDGARLETITSVFPSSTTAALTSLWTGCTPAEHGFMGYTLFLHEFGVRANMIDFSPIATETLGRGQLLDSGLKPEEWLAVPSLPQMLAKVGVHTYNLIEQPFQRSALSQVQIRGAKETRGFVSSSDMWVVLREWIDHKPHERALFVAYWSAIDTISHTYGPSSDTVSAEINNLAYSFEREFLRPLSDSARQGTLFLLTADHGQIDTPIGRTIYLSHHPDLRNRLLMSFTGEPRAAYLHVRQSEIENVRDYFASHLHQEFCVLDSQAALDAGLFGGGTLAPEARRRIGDLIVLPRANYSLWDKDREPRLLGRHGGMTEQEMLVPLIVARLDI